jgi:hypothetical protein
VWEAQENAEDAAIAAQVEALTAAPATSVTPPQWLN